MKFLNILIKKMKDIYNHLGVIRDSYFFGKLD